MRYPVYEAAKWIGSGDKYFIYSHALNRKLNPEEHSHDFFEVIFLFSGSALHRVCGTVQEMQPGQVIALRPGDPHVFVGQSDAIELYSISVVKEEFNRFLQTYGVEEILLSPQIPVNITLTQSQMRDILTLFRQLKMLRSTARDSRLRIILGITMHNVLMQQSDQAPDWLDNVLRQMNTPDNLTEGVPALMRLANLSEAQLCRVIKKRMLQTPQECIKEMRLNTAFDYVLSTDMTCEDIAVLVGYSSFSHFSTSFKQRFSISPSALRKTASLCRL